MSAEEQKPRREWIHVSNLVLQTMPKGTQIVAHKDANETKNLNEVQGLPSTASLIPTLARLRVEGE